MENEFWLERWARNETGFHQIEINPHLRQHWQTVAPAQGSKVFVPLCGKSQDMLWLKAAGHAVLGVELAPLAVQAFFEESRLFPQQRSSEKFAHCAADDIHILCGDFFDLTADDLHDVGAVYDRAALVALPPEMRRRYVGHLLAILPPQTPILLLTYNYPQQQMPGPPFAVSDDEVESLFGEHADIRLLAQFDTLEQTPRLKARGLSRLQESVFLVTLR
jgi:thiopurine S-methyltransferase